MNRWMRPLALWLVALWGLAHAADAPTVTVQHLQPHVYTVNPQGLLYINYRFAARGPTREAQRVFVHFIDGSGRILFQDDHDPPVASTQWYGDIAYERTVPLPASLGDGHYRIAVGLYNTATGVRLALDTGETDDPSRPHYVREEAPGTLRYLVGELHVLSRQIIDAPFTCGGRDVTQQLSQALRNLTDGQVLKLPFGVCRYGALDRNALRLDNKRNVQVVGHGAPSTKLLATNKQRSGFIVSASDGVLLRDFSIEVERAPGLQERATHADATGVYIERSNGVELHQLAIRLPLAAGISFYRSTHGRVTRSHVAQSAADGIHIAGPSSQIQLDHNEVFDSGDDALSSIGYLSGDMAGHNQDVVIEHNRARFRDVKWGSGIAVEGTLGAAVRNNHVERSGAAGIRIASIQGDNIQYGRRYAFRTAGVRGVLVSGNTLVDVKTRAELGHGAIHIAAHTADVEQVLVHDNRIASLTEAGTARDAIFIRGSASASGVYMVRDARVWNNRISTADPQRLGSWCLRVQADTTYNLALGRNPDGHEAPNWYQLGTAGARSAVDSRCTVSTGPTM